MKAFLSSPFNAFSLAVALQVFIFSCWAVKAKEDVVNTARTAVNAIRVFFMGYVPVLSEKAINPVE